MSLEKVATKSVCFNDASWRNNEFFRCTPSVNVDEVVQFVKTNFLEKDVSEVKCVDHQASLCQGVAEMLGCAISDSDYGLTISC